MQRHQEGVLTGRLVHAETVPSQQVQTSCNICINGPQTNLVPPAFTLGTGYAATTCSYYMNAESTTGKTQANATKSVC